MRINRYSADECTVVVRPGKRRETGLADRPPPFNLPYHRWRRRTTRDSMRGRCYRAEAEVRRQFVGQRTFRDLHALARYCRSVVESDAFRRRWPRFNTLMINLRGTGHCTSGPLQTDADGQVVAGGITISAWGMGWVGVHGGEMVVLHEIAHAICPPDEKHGRLWARTFLELVRLRLGRDRYRQLRDSFRCHRVPVTPFREVS